MKKLIFTLAFSMLLTISAFPDDIDPLTFRLTPGINLPVGQSTDYFDYGLMATFSTEYRIPPFPILAVKGDISYTNVPIKSAAEDSINTVALGGGPTLVYPLFWKIIGMAYGTVGGYYPLVTDPNIESYFNFYITAGAGLYFAINPALTVGLDFHYKKYFDFYNGIGLTIGTSLTPLRAKKLQIKQTNFNEVYPILYKYYDNNSLGKAILKNSSAISIKDIDISLFIEKYMDNPKHCISIRELPGNTEKEIDLFALFSEKILEITEDTKVSAKIIMNYTLKGKEEEREKTATLRIYNRNAMTWDDDEKAAAFVTAKDPVVLDLSKNVAGLVEEKSSRAVDKNLRMLIGLHEALRLYGLSYVVDPTTPYTEFSQDKMVVDFLQFPRQTLKYKAGDCDDLSILYCALLESIGIETAFVTTPGHIYIAVALNMEPEEAKKHFHQPDNLILQDNKVWLPLEVTMVQSGFLEAWQMGAKEWRENIDKGKANLYPTHTAWAKYEPVGFVSEKAEIQIPSKANMSNSFSKEFKRFVDFEIGNRAAKIEEQIKSSNNKDKYINRLGILYARYGLKDKAKKQFERIIGIKAYVPAFINLGNLYYLDNNYEQALYYYEQASKYAANNSAVLIQLARVYYEMENYKKSSQIFERVQSISPKLANRFAYLSAQSTETGRASEIAQREVVIWQEEQ